MRFTPKTEKVCTLCKELLPIGRFAKRNDHSPGVKSACIKCNNEKRRRIYLETKKPDDQREKNLKRFFGISVEDYEQMLNNQGGVCYICKSPPKGKRLAVDHDHTTGKIRSLLCQHCNTGLGHFRDSEELLTKAINYLKENN